LNEKVSEHLASNPSDR